MYHERTTYKLTGHKKYESIFIPDPVGCRFKRENSTHVSGDPNAASNITANADDRPSASDQGCLSSRGTSHPSAGFVWISRRSKDGIGRVPADHGLWDVGLHERNGTLLL